MGSSRAHDARVEWQCVREPQFCRNDGAAARGARVCVVWHCGPDSPGAAGTAVDLYVDLLDLSAVAPHVIRVGKEHKFIPFFRDIALLDHWNRLGESFPTMYRSGGCLWLAGYANRM